MSDAASRPTTATTTATTPPAAPAHRPARHARTDSAVMTRRWTVGVLALATVLLGAYLALVVTTSWLLASAWGGLTHTTVSFDLLSVATDVAPVLLVGWCTGLAASATLARGEALGARAAGTTAGALGAVAGAAVLSLTGLL